VAAYPKGWSRSDVDAAVAALTAAGTTVGDYVGRRPVRSVEFVSDGRACRLVERTPDDRPVWLALEFPWPAAWPDIVLTDEGDPYEEECADPSPPDGYALCSHDLPSARAVVDAGYADAARQPRALLSIDEFDGAMLTSGPRVALNGETAGWLLGLLRIALATAPPVDPADDVSGQVHPDYLESDARVHGTRAEVLHRLLWLQTFVWVEIAAVPAAATTRLRAAIDEWVELTAGLAAASRDPATDHEAVRQQVRELGRSIETETTRAERDGANENLILRMRHMLEQMRQWDVAPSLRAPIVEPTVSVAPQRRWWHRA
jgi:hypothetical protein